MKNIDFSTTSLQKKIYVLLINCNNPKFPRTQKQVCELLAIQKSTCSDAAKRLVELGFIAPFTGMK
ncbi:MAG: MarR family transcriptional regulator, partial [Methanomassiliicoccaceae archaeon]|nr:MarR family transcriptional regulator [Methanomassiliicoccaceae archaeon]